jgi:ATP-dependent DNA helicase RecG
MDLLQVIERVKNNLPLGESHYREFKTAWEGKVSEAKPRPFKEICRDIAEALVAFANADGGELLIGVEDDGNVSGVPHADHLIDALLQAPENYILSGTQLPMLAATKVNIEGQWVLYFSVAKGVSRIYQLSDGKCVRRKDKATLPVAFEDIQFERQEIRSREYDREFVDGAAVSDLNIVLLQTAADTYLRGMSVERYLQQMNLGEYSATGLRLRRAAVLLFAKDIGRWAPQCEIRILKVKGRELLSGEAYNVTADESIRGNLFELIEKGWENLRPYLIYKTDFGPDAKFEQRYLYPDEACQEALINAIAHRDYSNHRRIEVMIFDDRIEVRSPGALLSTINLKDLLSSKNIQESRNPFITRVLRENKYMRELGEGIQRIFRLMNEYDLSKPRFYSNSTFFSVSLHSSTIYTPQQLEWLRIFDRYNLSRLQKRIVVLGINEREISRHDIRKAIQTPDRDVYDQEITPLRESGILVETRTPQAAKLYAIQQKMDRDKVGHFKVVLANEADATRSKANIKGPVKETGHEADSPRGIQILDVPFNISTKELDAFLLEHFPGLADSSSETLNPDGQTYRVTYPISDLDLWQLFVKQAGQLQFKSYRIKFRPVYKKK